MKILSRLSLLFVGVVSILMGGAVVWTGEGTQGHFFGAWFSTAVFVALGTGCAYAALFGTPARIDEIMKQSPRIRWGTALALPSGMVLGAAALLGRTLPPAAMVLLIIALIAGIMALFFDMP